MWYDDYISIYLKEKNVMKTYLKLTAAITVAVLLLSAMTVAVFGEIGEPVDSYDKYGYYVYYDFENYGSSGNHSIYMRNSGAKNKDGMLCNPFGFLMGSIVNTAGTGTAVKEENGNTYYSFKSGGSVDYGSIAVLALQNTKDKSLIIRDAAELSFKLRLHEEQTMAEGAKLPLICARRGTSTATRVVYVFADGKGNIYANLSGSTSTLVYTNPGDGKFMDIAFRWYDASNTYSLFVNGEAVAESVPLSADLRNSTHVNRTYTDDFGVELTGAVGAETNTNNYRAIELLRRETVSEAFGYDVDDIKLTRIESAQRGGYYYENDFESSANGLALLATRGGAYIFSEKANSDTVSLAHEGENGYLNVKSGNFVGIKDAQYQTVTQKSYVVEFSVKAKPTHTSGYKALLGIVDNRNVNNLEMLLVDKDGSIYIERNESTKIDGFKLDGSQWLNFAVVVTKNLSNNGKFGSFNASATKSSLNNSYSFSYYINGKYVGTSAPVELCEWRIWTENSTTYSRTASNFDMTISHTEGSLDLNGLTVVADGVNKSTSTAGHIIYKSADGLTYYDVEYAQDNTTQVRYSTMTLTNMVDSREDSLRFFSGAYFEGGLDNIRIYEGTSPDLAYAALNSAHGGVMVDADFASFALASNSVEARTNASGSNVLGTVISAGVKSSSLARKSDNGIYSTLTLKSGNWIDLFVPVPTAKSGVIDVEYGFEITVKGLQLAKSSDTLPTSAEFFSNRFEDNAGYSATAWLMSVDADLNLWAGTYSNSGARLALYNEEGSRAKIDNSSWNSLKADIHLYKDSKETYAELSYYLDGKLLYLEDGTPAYRIENDKIALVAAINKFGGTNNRIRLAQPSGKTLTLDIKSFKVIKNEDKSPVYNSLDADFAGKLSEIRFTIPCFKKSEYSGYSTIVGLEKGLASGNVGADLILADLKSGALAIKLDGEVQSIYGPGANALTVADSAASVAIVYDDASGLARLFVNGALAYVKDGEKLVPVVNLPLGKALSEVTAPKHQSVILYSHLGVAFDTAISAESYGLKINEIKTEDTARVIGLQENSITNGVRIIAGIDSLYYTNIGFEIETFEGGISKGITEILGNTVFDSVVADGKTVKASDHGYRYLAAAVITEISEKISDNSFIVIRAFTDVDGYRCYDEEAQIIITAKGYYFGTRETIFENNFNGESGLPGDWSGTNGNVISQKNGELAIDAADLDLVNYYSARKYGSNYSLQGDFRVLSDLNENGAIALDLRVTDAHTYLSAGISAKGEWFIKAVKNGVSSTLASGVFDTPIYLGQTYTLNAICFGDHISLFVDGVFVGEATIPTDFLSGSVGVSVSSLDARVDDIILRSVTKKYDEKNTYAESFESLTIPTEWVTNATASSSGANPTYSTQSGALRITDRTSARLVVDLKKELKGDYVFEAELTALELVNTTRYMGLVLGAKDDGSLIAVNMRMSDGRVQTESLDRDGVWHTVAPETKSGFTPSVNTTYLFKLVSKNGFAEIYIDGALIVRFEIPEQFRAGRVGIILSQCAIEVDNAKLFEISEYSVSQEVEAIGFETFGTIAYENNFDGLTAVPSDWNKMTTATSTPANLTLSIENDALTIKDNSSAIVAVANDMTVSGDYSVEADLTFVYRANNDRYMGLLIGVQEDDSFAGIQMRLSDGRFELTKWDSVSKWANIGTTVYLKGTLPLEATRTYHFKLDVVNGYATAYVDGINCGGFQVPEKHLSGKVGIITSQATVKVDNFKVESLARFEITPVYETDFNDYVTTPTEWSKAAGTGANSTLETSTNGDRLVLKDTTGSRTVVTLDKELNGNDFVYEADIIMTEKHSSDSWWMGPVFGSHDDGSFVIMDTNVVSGKWYVEPWEGSKWGTAFVKSTDATILTSFKANTLHHFKLVVIGDKGTAYINGSEICTFTIPEKYRSGEVGIGFRNATVEVDNVRLCTLTKCDDVINTEKLYSEDFDGLSAAPAEWSKSNGSSSNSNLAFSIQNNELLLSGRTGARSLAIYDETVSGDFILEADITAVTLGNSTRYMGLVFGVQEDGAFASASMRMSDGRILGETCTAQSVWNTLSTKYAANTPSVGTKYNFKVTCISGVATIYLDGVEYGSFTVPAPYTSGKVGAILSESVISIDNVKISRILGDEKPAKGLNAKADTLKDATLSLGENHVMHNKTLTLGFNVGQLASGQSILLGHGKNVKGGSAVEITATEVVVYDYSAANAEIFRAAHGLDVKGNVKVIIDTDVDTANVRIVSETDTFISPLFAWSGRDGEIFAESLGAELTNVTLNWVSSGLENKVWIIGGANLDHKNEDSLAYYLGKGGLALIGSYDETSESALEEFENALKHSIPEYAVWAIGADEADGASAVNAAWKASLDRFLALCKKNGVTPVLTTASGSSNSLKNSVVTSSGYRYADLASANGAEATYNQLVKDFTDIKDYMTGIRIKVATYNTGDFAGVSFRKGSDAAYKAYNDLFESTGADVWALQEDDEFFNDTTSELPYDAVYGNVLLNYERNFTGKYNGKAFLSKYELYDVAPVYYPAAVTSYAPGGTKGYSHAWFLTGKVMIDGKEITLVSLHLDWACKERRATQLKTIIDFVKEQEYCIVMGDFNPEDYVNNVELSKDLLYEEEYGLFKEIGMDYANAGRFGIFDTIVAPKEPQLYGPWDNIIVTSNIEILSAERVYATEWMHDHAIVLAEIAIN